MGNQRNVKQLRGQVRQVVQELLPQVFTEELVKALEKKLEEQAREAFERIENRQKDIQSYIIRNTLPKSTDEKA